MKSAIALGIATALLAGTASAATTLPPDVKPTCVVDKTQFDGWFASGKAAPNGVVKPASGVTFPPLQNTACDFYKWGSQMFLWLTSPQNSSYVFQGSSFLNVVPDGDGFRYVPNTQAANGQPAAPNFARVRAVKTTNAAGAEQAGGGVLIAQKGFTGGPFPYLTYYGLHTNDVFASYLTSQKAGLFANTSIATNFPTTAADLALVEKTAGKSFPDGVALTMELKTSWVDARAVADPSRYVLMNATVQTYSTANPNIWKPSGSAPGTFALVGVHIVATVNGHPEMVWSTFEHVDNAPDAPYYYTNTQNVTAKAAYDSSGVWTFTPTNAPLTKSIAETARIYDGSPEQAGANKGDIVNSDQGAVKPASVIRLTPWGNQGDSQATADVANATDLISINASLVNPLAAMKDVRANYLQIGGVWTQKGQIPKGGTDDSLRGSLKLANATMETFFQYPDSAEFQPHNCFGCHNSKDASNGLNVSHIFKGLKPLP
ncbi:hypothetical protein [Azospirillum griseum]|uniref:Cytochrome c family protein n=1 Tax=Azospirillum griseum TaxID=2496639 RepID=A0A3S0K4V1_9PROT|nr:hypothetical protein [Azospirillum griseum]RTR20603.1 hypothetical protein EJ903_10815 [Azospirillum griseum]